MLCHSYILLSEQITLVFILVAGRLVPCPAPEVLVLLSLYVVAGRDLLPHAARCFLFRWDTSLPCGRCPVVGQAPFQDAPIAFACRADFLPPHSCIPVPENHRDFLQVPSFVYEGTFIGPRRYLRWHLKVPSEIVPNFQTYIAAAGQELIIKGRERESFPPSTD